MADVRHYSRGPLCDSGSEWKDRDRQQGNPGGHWRGFTQQGRGAGSAHASGGPWRRVVPQYRSDTGPEIAHRTAPELNPGNSVYPYEFSVSGEPRNESFRWT